MIVYLRKIGIQKDVIAEKLVAVVSVDVGAAKLRFGLGFDAEQALDDYVVYFGPHVRTVNAKLL